MLPHDFRRTAVRDSVSSGVPEPVAMTPTDDKTRAVFDRYHIVGPTDIREAADKLAGTFSGTLAEKPEHAEACDSVTLRKFGGGGWIRTTDIGLMRPNRRLETQ